MAEDMSHQDLVNPSMTYQVTFNQEEHWQSVPSHMTDAFEYKQEPIGEATF